MLQYALQLWYLILKLDVDNDNEELQAIQNATDNDKVQRVLLKANLLQIIVCRMCLFFDKLVVLERMSMGNEVGNMFKNVLNYAY